jgi:hypothetical protein
MTAIAEEFIGPERWHGTAGGTTNHDCKCLACRTMWAQTNLQSRKDRAARITADDPRHGKSSFYLNHGCRCDKCRKAHTSARRESRNRNRQASP